MFNATNKIDANEVSSYAGFDSMEDDDLGAPVSLSNLSKKKFVSGEQVLFKEQCSRCGGSGRIRAYNHVQAGECFQCHGEGFEVFKSSPEARAKARTKAATKKVETQKSNIEQFEASFPDIAAWWKHSDFPFAMSLREAVIKYGSLTEGQMNAAMKCVNKIKEMKAAREARIEAAPVVEISHINNALSKARENGLKRPKMRLLGNGTDLVFSRAPDHGVNAGAVYVAQDDLYLGKIVAGKFVRGRDCTDELEAATMAACAAPLEAAVAYGRQFGSCSCCGKELTNAESIELGIGPICRAKFFG